MRERSTASCCRPFLMLCVFYRMTGHGDLVKHSRNMINGACMIDMQELSARMDEMKRNVVSRGIQCNVDEIVLAYSKYKACTQKLDSLRASMNQLSRKIGTDGSLDREAKRSFQRSDSLSQ
ncbi:hypothetical protein B6O47_17910 [Salmonella enterica]|nr:hypothetical protein [Salmonella enterica]